MAVDKNTGTKHRVQVVLNDTDFERLKFWAEKKGCSINDYVLEAILFLNRWEMGDVDLPTLEIQRMNQLVDTVKILSSNVHSLEQVVTSGFDSLLGLTRGENYLLEEDESGM